MHLFNLLRDLPVSLLVSSFVLAASALPVHATELTPDNFADLTASGLWFIEFFSPYCSHCREFAPTWETLVEESAQQAPTVKLAQVNCAVHGDLCSEKGITAYPTLRMYNKGKDLEKFTGYRNLPDLHAFIKRHVDAVSPPPETKVDAFIPVNISGEVAQLTDTTFASMLATGPMFVKFFAPWCGHCKKLAPIWRQLAKHMQGKLTIAEVNCDDHAALCKAHDVTGYPTLAYLSSGGLKSEYNGGRKLEQLKAFADKASSATMYPIKTDELDDHVKENEVVYLLVHSASDTHILDTVRQAATPLLGSPSILTSSDPSLLSRFSVEETSTWALIALKDHDSKIPSAVFTERSATLSSIRTWLLSHRIPTTLELTQDTFQSVMNAPQSPLVVIAAVGPALAEKVRSRLVDIAAKWRVKTKGTGLTSGREVVFVSMDAERWRDWMKSMYGIVGAETATELDNVRVVVTDHKRLVYYDKDPADSRIKISSTASLFATVEAAAAGKLEPKNSENTVERLARYLNAKMISLEAYVVSYPWRTAFFALLVFAGVFLGLKKLVADDVPSDYRKVERLD